MVNWFGKVTDISRQNAVQLLVAQALATMPTCYLRQSREVCHGWHFHKNRPDALGTDQNKILSTLKTEICLLQSQWVCNETTE